MAGHLSRSSFVTRLPCSSILAPSYADILSSAADNNSSSSSSEEDALDPYTQEGFLKYYRNFVLARTAMDDWNDDNGAGFNAYEECEGNQMLSWKGKGYGTVLKLLMVSCSC